MEPASPMTEEGMPERSVALDAATCWSLLATETIGRVVYTENALPSIRPVTYAVDGHHIVFRTAAVSALARAVTDRVVAFEVDSIDREYRTGWSVVATGIARPLTSPGEMLRAAALQVAPWVGGRRELFLVITPAVITGRNIG
jgi:nitroimidazol reductase NimA-like FMN-containing flavoprotein (pyridoxamine 5'-phosphate oxidase superfamily)